MIQSSGQYYRPDSLGELKRLVENLDSDNADYIFYAGGTDVVPGLKKTGTNNKNIIFLQSLKEKDEFLKVKMEGNVLYIGALMTLCDVSKNEVILKHLSCVSETAKLIASPQIRNKATIGGNILVDNRCIFYNQSELNRESHNPCFKDNGNVCHLVKSAKKDDFPSCRARCVSDLVPPLLILDSFLVLDGPKGRREVSLRKFFKGDGIQKNNLEKGEILIQIKVPIDSNKKLNYEKLRIRNAIDFPSLGVAVSKNEKNLEVAITGVATSPIYYSFEKGEFSSWDDLLDAACKICMREATPIKQDFFPPSYRKKMISVFIRRLAQKHD